MTASVRITPASGASGAAGASGAPRAPRAPRSDAWIRLALITGAALPFARTLLYGFVYDDAGIILRNPAIHGWHSLFTVWRQSYWTVTNSSTGVLYRPLPLAIFALLWNGAHHFAIAFHLFAIAAHVVATLLLWQVLRRGVPRWPAAAGALWFAVHPVHVEAVASVANSTDTLVGVWSLALVLCLAPAGDAHATTSHAPRRARLIAAALLYAAALLTKESGVVVPLLAGLGALLWRAPRPRRAPQSVRASVSAWLPVVGAWLGVALAVAIVRARVLGTFTPRDAFVAPGLDGLSAVQRITAMVSLGGRVARLLFWPGALNPHYGPSTLLAPTAAAPAAVATIAIALMALGAATLFAVRPPRDTRPLAALLWIGIAYAPASNLLVATGQILAERTLYVPSIGAAMLVGWSIDQLLALASRGRRRDATRRVLASALAIGVMAICARAARHARDYARVWRDQRSLFTYMTAVDPAGYRGYQLLALEYANHHQLDESQRLYARAYALAPHDPLLAEDYAAFLLDMHRPHDALAVAEPLMSRPDARSDRRAVAIYLSARAASESASRASASDPH